MSDDLDSLMRDLGRVPADAGKNVKPALERTAFLAKESWRDHAKRPSGGHAAGFPFSIDYDTKGGFPKWEAEIGPNLGSGQGALGILEDSPGGVAASPQKARPAIAKRVEEDFEKGLDRAVDDALRRAGL